MYTSGDEDETKKSKRREFEKNLQVQGVRIQRVKQALKEVGKQDEKQDTEICI